MKVAFFIILAMLTALSAMVFDPFVPCGPELLQDPGLNGNDAAWKTHSPPGTSVAFINNTVRLTSHNPDTSVQIQQGIPRPDTRMVRFIARMRAEDVVPGDKKYNKARVILAQNDGHVKCWDVPHTLFALTGTHPWKTYTKVFDLLPETRNLIPTFQLSRATGTLWVTHPSLIPVTHAGCYAWARGAAYTIWGLFFVFLASTWRKGMGAFFKPLVFLSFAAILVGTLVPNHVKHDVTERIEHKVEQLSPQPPQDAPAPQPSNPLPLAQAGHFALFALFGFGLAVVLFQSPMASAVLDLIILAGSTELLQFYIHGRTPLWVDFFTDIAGGMTGILLAGFTWRKWRREKSAA